MDDATRLRRAATFGPAADLYDDARPGYPAAAVAWAVPTPGSHVLDLGAGTGKLTRALVAAGHDVVAVDPSEQMLARLHVTSPDVATRLGSGEATGLADASVDAITVGSAFHWFTRPDADAEIARVLRPGGTVALLWNPREHGDPMADAYDRIAGSPDRDRGARRLDTVLDPTWFGPTETAQFPHEVAVTAERLVAMAASRSYVLDLPEGERDQFLDRIRVFARDELGLTGSATRPLRFRCTVLRAERRL